MCSPRLTLVFLVSYSLGAVLHCAKLTRSAPGVCGQGPLSFQLSTSVVCYCFLWVIHSLCVGQYCPALGGHPACFLFTVVRRLTVWRVTTVLHRIPSGVTLYPFR